MWLYPLQNDTILEWSKLETFADCSLTLSSISTRFNMERKSFRKTLWKKMKLLKMSKFTFFHSVIYAICILKSFNNHISVVICSLFEFGTVSKWCFREWVKGCRTCPWQRRKQWGKGENAGNQHFLLFSQCSQSYQRNTCICIHSLELHLYCCLQMLWIWTCINIFLFGINQLPYTKF